MESHRSTFHVQAIWLTVEQPDGAVDYYALDEEGALILTDGKLIPHHSVRDDCSNEIMTNIRYQSQLNYRLNTL